MDNLIQHPSIDEGVDYRGRTPETRYNGFKHLCLSLFAKPSDLFVMLTAYFDETGTSPNQKVPMVAGYLASTFQWRRFGEQWDKLLCRSNVPVDPNYGVRFVHRNELQRFQGHFKNWTEPERDAFIAKAYLVIRSCS
jgi:hypothetical protein